MCLSPGVKMSFTQPHTTINMPAHTPFADYHHEFTTLLSSLETHIQRADAGASSDAADTLDAADAVLSEAASQLKTLELEAQTSGTKLRPVVTAARESLSKGRASLRAARTRAATRRADVDRRQLLPGSDVATERFTDATALLTRGGESIVESRRRVAETEMIGASILEDLQSQRGTITRARGHLGAVDDGVEQSGSILNSLQRRAFFNRIALYVVAIVIAFVCLAVIYARLIHPYKS